MIKFFRRIRQKLLTQNLSPESSRAGRYLLYALGEIILVVIGILIAVAINDAYNASKNEEKIRSILTQVQADIIVDARDAKRIFRHYIRKDSTAHNIYNDLVNVNTEAWKLRPYEGSVNFSINRSGYERLMDNLENLPKKYSELLPILNEIYVVIQEDVIDANDNLISKADDPRFNKAYTNPEDATFRLNRFNTEEAKEYLLNDPFLKNRTLEYMDAFRWVATVANRYKVRAFSLYKQIDTLLGKEDIIIPEELVLLPGKEIIEPLLGEYTHFKGFEATEKLSITLENDQLYYSIKGEKHHLYWHQDNVYFNRGSAIFMLFKDEKGQYFLKRSNDIRIQIYIKE